MPKVYKNEDNLRKDSGFYCIRKHRTMKDRKSIVINTGVSFLQSYAVLLLGFLIFCPTYLKLLLTCPNANILHVPKWMLIAEI